VRGAGAGSEDRRRRECTASHGRIEAGRLAVGGGGHLALGPQERMLFRLAKKRRHQGEVIPVATICVADCGSRFFPLVIRRFGGPVSHVAVASKRVRGCSFGFHICWRHRWIACR
jgi:hypothetical protein